MHPTVYQNISLDDFKKLRNKQQKTGRQSKEKTDKDNISTNLNKKIV